MFRLPRVFHVSHVVDDLGKAMDWYREVFAPEVWQETSLFGNQLALLAVGEVALMPMQPPPGSSVDKFKTRFGEHLHSLALYVDEPVELIERLRAHDYHLTGSRGTALEEPTDEIWVQPKQAPLVIEFFQPRPSMNDIRDGRAELVDHGPLGVLGAWCTNVARDVGVAMPFYVDVLGGDVVAEGVVTPYGTTSTFVRFSDEVVIEIAVPSDPEGIAARDLEAGSTFHAVTFRVADLDRALAHLGAKGVATHRVADGHAVAEPADTLGVLMRFTDREVAA